MKTSTSKKIRIRWRGRAREELLDPLAREALRQHEAIAYTQKSR